MHVNVLSEEVPVAPPRAKHNSELVVRSGPSVLKETAALHVTNNLIIFPTERNA